MLPAPIESQSNPEQRAHAFSYTITISNLGMEPVQLVKRHWMIQSGGEAYDEVLGDGVVGLQPIIKPGESFEYTSGAVIPDPLGCMKGTYTLKNTKGDFFKVEIPEFELVFTSQLN